MRHQLRQFRALPFADKQLLVSITLIVPMVEIGLREFGFKRVLRWLRHWSVVNDGQSNQLHEVQRHKRLLFLFHQQFPFAGRCLARSLTLWWLLQRRGIATDLRFGVRQQEGRFEAHAWVEYRGQPLTLDPKVQQHYVVFDVPIWPTAMRFS